MNKTVSQLSEEKIREIQAKNAYLEGIIKPLVRAKYTVDCMFADLEDKLAGFARDWGLNLDPEYQRGHVWTAEQRLAYIEGILRGTVGESQRVIQFNAPHWTDDKVDTDLPREIQIVDGLQRLTTVRMFLRGEIKPFGLNVEDLSGSRYDVRRSSSTIHLFKLYIHDFSKKSDLLAYYLDINAGGTPHSASEIERVRGLLDEATQEA